MRIRQCLHTGLKNEIQLHTSILTYFLKIGQTNYKSLKIKIVFTIFECFRQNAINYNKLFSRQGFSCYNYL